MNKKAVFLAVFLLFPLMASALDLGLVAGSSSRPSSFFYGFSLGTGIVIPMLKLEFEGWRNAETGMNSLSAAVKFRPKFGVFAPYVALGAGSEFTRLNFRFSEYDFFTSVGGGFHLFFTSMISLRADLRFLKLPGVKKTRIGGGFFIHL